MPLQRPDRDARVGDDELDALAGVVRGAHDLGDARGIADVERPHGGLTTPRLDLRADRLEGLLIPGRQADM